MKADIITEFHDGNAIIHGITHFDLARSCTCAQAFRWRAYDGGMFGVAGGRAVIAREQGETLTLSPCNDDDLPFWINYFDLERDYGPIEAAVCRDSRIACCMDEARGIRVFKQEPFETLITFIISANNNVGRIRGIVERICAAAGEAAELCGIEYYRFPTVRALAALSEDALTKCGAGYRAEFIKRTAQIIANGYDLDALRGLDINLARARLMEFPGVGPKVADCVLLFSLGYAQAFPMDVWMKRASRELFFGGRVPKKAEVAALVSALGPEAGIAQQFIFHYAKQKKLGAKPTRYD